MRTDRYLLGVSYYPEQTTRETWTRDFRLMRELGFNTVRMGEFAWSRFEPRRGARDFAWMEEAISLAASEGLKTILCTPTASPPPWLRKAHPEILGGNERGPFDYGARKGYCVNSKDFLSAALSITEAIGAHFAANDSILAWQVDNEPGFPFICSDPNCLAAFHRWLEAKYGSIDQLNAAWFNVFWSHEYGSWDEIELPLNRPDGEWNPGEKLDYRRFFSDSFASYLSRQTSALRQAGIKVPIHTNWPYTFWSVDLFKCGEFLDTLGWDNYARFPGTVDVRELLSPGMHHDLCRCAGKDGLFYISEQAAQAPSHSPQAGVRLQTLQDAAHGASGTIFFEWRPPLGGAEHGYLSVLNLDGSPGPAAAQFQKLSRDFDVLNGVLAGSSVKSEAAVIFSFESMWDEGWRLPNHAGYDRRFDTFYRGLRSLNHNLDIVPPGADISGYKLIYAPGLRVVSDEVVSKLEQWVEAGGVLVLSSQAGAKDLFGKFRTVREPGALGRLAGVEIAATAGGSAMTGTMILGLADEPNEKFGVEFVASSARFESNDHMDEIKLAGAQPVAVYRGGLLDGTPAITRNLWGNGSVIFVGTDSCDFGFHEELAKVASHLAGLKAPFDASQGVFLSKLNLKNGGDCVFAMNFSSSSQKVTIGQDALDLLSGMCYDGTAEIPPFDVRVFVASSQVSGSPQHQHQNN